MSATDHDAFRELERRGWSADGKGEAYDSAIDAAPDQRLLDVACGPGYVASAAVDAGLTVTGLDFSPSMLAVAGVRVPGVQFRQGDAEQLPFEDAYFHQVTCAFGLLHFGDAARAVAEAYRVLRPDGRYSYAVWEVPAPGTFMGIVGGAIRSHGDPGLGAPPGPDFFGYADTARGTEMMAAVGFTDVQRSTAPVIIKVSPDAIIDAVYAGSVRTASMLNAQPAAARAKIHADIVTAATDRAVDGIAAIPMPAVIFAGRK